MPDPQGPIPPSATVSIREIAAKLGVHHSTVSRALNNDPRISAKRKAAIQEVAAAMGYRPSPAISSMMRARRARNPTPRSLNVAFLHNATKNEALDASFTRRILRGVQKRSDELGYLLQVFSLNREGVTERTAARILYHRGIKGVIIPPLRGEQTSWEFDFSRVSAVAIGYSLLNPVLHRVADHHSLSMQRALREMIAKGFRRIGLVLRQRTHEHVSHFWTGMYLYEVMENPNCARIPILISPRSAFSGDPVQNEIAAWLTTHQPDAVIAENDGSADRVKTIALELGLKELCVGSMLVNSARIRYPGIDQRPEWIGREAMNLLNELVMQGEVGVPEHPKTVLTLGQWVEPEA